MGKIFSYTRLSGSRISYENSLLTKKHFISNLGNLVLWAWSESNVFARKHSSLFPRPGLASFVFLIFVLFSSYAYSAQVTLIWNPVTHPDLAGYKIYYGNSSGTYDVTTDAGNQTSWTITNLIDNETYYFAVTAYDSYANESDYSNEVSTTFTDMSNMNLVYTPVTPCKIVDTRNTAQGIIDASTERDFHVYGGDGTIGAQGGNPSGCPSPLGEPLAAHINMVAVNPTGKGNLQAFPIGVGPGGGLSVNFNMIDTNLANAGTVKTTTGTGPDITVTSRFSDSHAHISVLGYYYAIP